MADRSVDLGDDTLQGGLNGFLRYFRQHAPAVLYGEIRSRMTSPTELGFQEDYLLDLILHEAVSQVVRHLSTHQSFSRRNETVPLDGGDVYLETPSTVPDSPTSTPDLVLPPVET